MTPNTKPSTVRIDRTASIARPRLRAQSEPPPGDSTQAYDQRELSRLLQATDSTLSVETLERNYSDHSAVHARSANELPTTRPPAFASSSSLKASTSEGRRKDTRSDTIPDSEELTIAYSRPPVIPSPSPTPPKPLKQKKDAASFRRETAERTVITPFKFELESDDASHDTSKKQRPASLRPPEPRDSIYKPLFFGVPLLGLGLLVAATVFPAFFGTPGKSLRAQYDRAFRAIEPVQSRAVVASAKPRLIELNVVVNPPQAKVFLDGHETSNPLKIAYPADDALHELRIELEGRPPKTHRLKFDRDISVMLGF